MSLGVLRGLSSRFSFPRQLRRRQKPSSVYGPTAPKATAKSIDSPAINSAIEAASENGGGTVYFPAGDYLTGSIRLRNNITLYLDNGCTLIAISDNPELNYDRAEKSINDSYQDYGHSHWHNGLIWGDSLHEVSIIGQGKIYGKGLLRDWAKESKAADKTISLYRCRNVLLRDFTISHGGWFAILAAGADNLTLDNLKIDTNRDGVDIDCCKNVHVSNLSINSPYDDGLCLKKYVRARLCPGDRKCDDHKLPAQRL